MSNNYKQARSLARIGAIIGIVLGVLYSITIIGLIIGIPMIIGGTLTISKLNDSDEELYNSSGFFLGWGIFFIIFTLISGILYLMAYFKMSEPPISYVDDKLSQVDRAYNMYRQGVISKEEFEEIKAQSLYQ